MIFNTKLILVLSDSSINIYTKNNENQLKYQIKIGLDTIIVWHVKTKSEQNRFKLKAFTFEF